MKIFISYSHQDKKWASMIADLLKQENHEVWIDSWSIKAGDNLLKKIEQGLSEADAIVFLISKNSLASKSVMHEFSAIAFGELSKRRQRIIPVLIDKSQVPSYLSQYMYLDLAADVELGLQRLTQALRAEPTEEPEYVSAEITKSQKERTYDKQIQNLSKALHGGRLTLVCGAGISVGAGVPSWNSLLLTLLESMMRRVSNDLSISLKGADAGEFQSRYSPSSLIMGKYLKNNLGKDFLKEVRDALYSGNPTSCDIIDAIVDLSRPQRDGKPLDSIVTFNFDALLEENLKTNNISHRAIHGEGIRNSPNELPIYHVHGYLPRSGRIPGNMEVVFSEDAYHSQFIEPFSWSNLIQLNKLSQNTCLFIGLSLSDPNLRRLLDVANRKNPEKSLNHYLIKKAPNNSNSSDTMDDLALLLEEQDANDLGLNMIWIEDFTEIAEILKKIALTNASS
ncbi:MAG: TIR domain-containing protein [Candidatus Thiodiazotropha sp.]